MAKTYKKRKLRKHKSRKISKSIRRRKGSRRIRQSMRAGQGYDPSKFGVALPGLTSFKPKKNNTCIKTVWSEDGSYYYENPGKEKFYNEEIECINDNS